MNAVKYNDTIINLDNIIGCRKSEETFASKKVFKIVFQTAMGEINWRFSDDTERDGYFKIIWEIMRGEV